jgi:transposase
VGVDLAKRVIQVHAADAAGRLLSSRALAREKFIAWCAQLPAGCVVAMEASSSAHHWARRLRAMGLDARIVAAHLVTPFNRIRGLLAEFGLVVAQSPMRFGHRWPSCWRMRATRWAPWRG